MISSCSQNISAASNLFVHTCHRFKCWVGTTYCQLGKARGNGMKVFGERLARLLGGHSSLRTGWRATCPSRAANSQAWRPTMLATTRILVFKLVTARVFCYPPTTPNSLIAPSLLPRDQSVPTISSDKGNGTTPPPPTVETSMMVD